MTHATLDHLAEIAPATTAASPAIDLAMQAFASGDVAALLARISDDVDFRIDHYQDDTDNAWQRGTSKAELMGVLQRLAAEVFPRGTRVLRLHSQPLGNGWALTRFEHQFFYGVQQRDVQSLTWILSHTRDGQIDYFRENVTTTTPV